MVIFLFWLAVMAFTLLALGLLLPPLLRTNTGMHRRAIERELVTLKRRLDAGEIDAGTCASERERLSAALLAAVEGVNPPPARILATVLALILPAAALVLYFSVGRPDALDMPAQPTGEADVIPQDLSSAVAGLEARLRENPDDVAGWLLLARSYRAMERFDDFLRATASAYALAPNEPDVLVEQAEALALSTTRRLDGESRRLLEQALAIDGAHQKALWLLGTSEMQAGNHAGAIDYWQRLRALLPEGDSVTAGVDTQIAAAQSRLSGAARAVSGSESSPVTTGAPPAAATNTDTATGPQLLVTVDIDEALKPRLAAGDTLFVFVRSPTGGPPLAIRRIATPTFPVSVTLTQADRMIDGVQIEAGAEVSVGARVSKSGQAQAQPGDLEAESRALKVVTTGTLTLRIDRIVGD